MSQIPYIQDMKDPLSVVATGPSQVASFYAGQNVLLTGGTGFLGKLLTERILRSCPNVKTLFLLVRAKKEKSPERRFKELFDDVVFDRLQKKQPEFTRKIKLIEGDIVEVGLGLSSEQRELLRSTNIVIHGAATVRFDEKLRIAASINVRGTKELLSLAKEMADLKAFVHISTAYSNCSISDVIEEKFYPPPIDSEKLLRLLDILDDASLDRLTPVLVGKWPNTYAFTKAVAEDTIRRNCQGLPMCIVRPSIVTATAKEPVAGWIDNMYGPTGVFFAVGLGLLRTLHCYEDMVADIIPADYAVSTIITAADAIGKPHADSSTNSEMVEPPIYNVVSSCQRPITWGEFSKYMTKYGLSFPSMVYLWYPCFRLNKYRWVNKFCIIFLHLIPAAIVDSLAWITGRKPMLWKAYSKIHKFCSVIEYFSLKQWQFHNDNVLKLWKSLSPADLDEFHFDMESLDWEDYFYNHVRGLRVYLLKDPLDTLPQARVKHAKLKVAHYTLVTVLYGFLLWLLWTCLRFSGLW